MKKIVLVISLLASASVFAEGSSGGSSSSGSSSDGSRSGINLDSEIDTIRDLLAAEQFKQASRRAQVVINQDWYNADAWNLMGFSQRKLGNYRKSEKAYARALKFNPEHKGALEYQGELFITLGQLDKARDNRARLVELCPSGCEQLDDLDAALLEAEG